MLALPAAGVRQDALGVAKDLAAKYPPNRLSGVCFVSQLQLSEAGQGPHLGGWCWDRGPSATVGGPTKLGPWHELQKWQEEGEEQ